MRLSTPFSSFSWSGNERILVCKFYMSDMLIEFLILDMSDTLGNIYIESDVLVAFVKYILLQLYSHCTRNCICWYSLESENLFCDEKNFKIFLYTYILLPKKQPNRFFKNFHKSGMVGRRKLGDCSLNCIFNAF